MKIALALLACAVPQELANPSFERPGDPPSGWSREIGANNAESGPGSRVAVDPRVSRDGKASLRLSGDAETMLWSMVFQDVPCDPGDRATFTVAARFEGVRREGRQFASTNVLLGFRDGSGQRLMYIPTAATIEGDRDWTDLHVGGIAPPGTTTARIVLFLTKTGTVWFDDVRARIEPTEPFGPEVARSAFDALAFHLERTYPFFGVAGRPDDPGELVAGHRERALEARDVEGFVEACTKMLRGLDDVHVWVQTPKDRIYTSSPNRRPANFNERVIRKALAEVVDEGQGFLVGRLEAGPGYVLTRHLFMDEDELRRMDEAMDGLADVPAWVLDVRPNQGGRDDQGWFLAGRFARKPLRYGSFQHRDASRADPSAFLAPNERWLQPRRGRLPDGRPVVVLQGPYTVSAAETLVEALSAIPTVTTIGQPTRGSRGNPRPFDLLPGYQVGVPTWRCLSPDGTCAEGVGIPPDVQVDAPPLVYVGRDPTLAKALEILRR